MELRAHKLVQLHAWINTESITIACPDYKEYHTVGFNANGSITEPQQDTDTGDVVSGACLADVFQMAKDMANCARRCQQSSHLLCPGPAPLLVSAVPHPIGMKPLVQALRAAVYMCCTRYCHQFLFLPALAFTPAFSFTPPARRALALQQA
jgi:hypothetical protein